MSPLPLIHRILQSFLFAFLALVCGIAGAQVVPGYDAGTFLTGFPGGLDSAYRVIYQPDGKYIVVGQAWFGNQQFAMTRFNANGTVDTTYGANHNGTQLEPIGSGNAEGMAAAFDASGKLVVAGHVTGTDNIDRFAIARFNADGTLDLSFGGGGSEVAVGPGNAGGRSMVIQSSGRILVGGYSMSAGGHRVLTVQAYTPVDTIDTTFGSGGRYIAADSGSDLTVNAMALLAGDKVLIAGGNGANLIVQRLNADGSLDTTFGTAGTATIAGGGEADEIALYPDGRIAIVGTVSNGTQLAVVRLNANGTLDTSFNTSGIATMVSTDGGVNTLFGRGLVVLSDGSIVVAGSAPSLAGNRVMIAKLTSAGAVDTAFGTSGKTLFFVGSADAQDIAQRPTGGFFVVGSELGGTENMPNGSTDTLTAAFTAAGALDNTFNTSGYKLVDVAHPPALANASALQSDGKLVAVGRICAVTPCSLAPNAQDKAVVIRYLANGAIDTTFGAGKGYVKIPNLLTGNAVAIDASQRIVVGGVGLSVFNSSNVPSMAFARVNADGTMDTSFAGTGTLVVQAGSAHEEISALRIQSSGRIVGAGFVKPSTWMDSVFVGVTTSGSLDGTFGSGGQTVVPVSTGDDEISGMTLQADGSIVGAGWAELVGGSEAFAATRLTANGQLDTTFGSPNGYVTIAFPGNARAYATTMQGSNILVGGYAFSPTNTTNDFALARLLPTGALDTSFGTSGKETDDFNHNHNHIFALAVLPDGKIVAAGENYGFFGVVRYLANGGLDTSFGTGGSTAIRVNFMAGADHANSLNVASDGTAYMVGNASNAIGMAMIAVGGSGGGGSATASYLIQSSANPSTSGQSVTLTVTVSGSAGTPSGSVTFNDNGTAIGACSSLTLASGVAQCPISSLTTGTHSITVTYSGDGSYAGGTSGAFSQTVNPVSTSAAIALSPSSLDFGGNSMGTTSLPMTITVTNTGSSTLTVNGVAVSSQFGQTNDCTSVAPSSTCTITVTFTPSPAPGPLNSGVSVTGSLTVSSNAASGDGTAPLAGVAEKTLVTHYYQAILRRNPDGGGKAFWISESDRMTSLGANVNEIWYAMAMSFMLSNEYVSQGRDDAGFVTDLYNTFFNRPPDASGLNYWTQQMASGTPRGVVLVSFMFSPEFQTFTQGIFGNTTARAEVDVVGDFYRGLLSRLPDTAGFNNWVGAFRQAQCGNGDVYGLVEAISSGFANSPEYAGRNRTNSEYVGDLYNAFLRRGGDQGGVQFWINQLDTHAMTRDEVRRQFIATPEFNNRVNAIINQGCMH